MRADLPTIRNEQTIALDAVPALEAGAFADTMAELLADGARACAYFAVPRANGRTALYAVCADDRNGICSLLSSVITDGRFPSLASRFPQVQLFEREIHEQTGLLPEGHPWLKPVRFPQRNDAPSGAHAAIGDMDFFRVDGHDVHEVAVGPVHAGIIEPGHFRFQCHGETVYHLEISLGYQHRGVERALRGGPYAATRHLMEVVAGDTSVGHATAYSQIVESLSGHRPSAHADALRALALELERCANHTGDLGALAGDIGYLPTLSYCGRIRGDFLNLTAIICGNRFGRGIVVPGGVGCDLDESRARDLSRKLQTTLGDFVSATGLLWEEPSVLARFDGTGALSRETADSIGLVGPAARACGCTRDVRQDYAHGYYRFSHIPVPTFDTGDVLGRTYVRWREVQESVEFLLEHLANLPQAKAAEPMVAPLQPRALAFSMVEGWRGEICHVAITGDDGRFEHYQIVDPSFHNWFGLALALRGQQISDFPLCNKSFNLSYCGFDL